MGMVAITNDTHIWAIRIPEAQSQGATILDLRTEQGRADANLTQDQDPKWATATHGALISGTVPLSAYLAVGPAPAHHPSPLFHVSRDIWSPPDDGNKTHGPQKGFDPCSGREFKTLSSESLDHISLAGIQRVSALAALVKAELSKHHPPPLWPGLGDILGASDASVKKHSSSRFAKPSQRNWFSGQMEALHPR